MPVDTLQNTENLVTAVQGAHRYKFMKRPIVPFLHAVPPDILLAPPTVSFHTLRMSAHQFYSELTSITGDTARWTHDGSDPC